MASAREMLAAIRAQVSVAGNQQRETSTDEESQVRAAVVREIGAGGTPVDPQAVEKIVRQRLAMKRGTLDETGRRMPTRGEANRVGLVGIGGGLVEGLAQIATFPADVTLDIFTAGPARRLLRQIRGEKVDPTPALPLTEAVAKAMDEPIEAAKRVVGVGTEVNTDVGTRVARIAGNVLAPGPLDVVAGRQAKNVKVAAEIAQDASVPARVAEGADASPLATAAETAPARANWRTLPQAATPEAETALRNAGVDVDGLKSEIYDDPLTGGPNRRAWQRMVETEDRPVKGVVDLDNLKFVNDRVSHSAGDSMLRAAHDMIAARATEAGIDFARVGGDEFYLQGADAAQMRKVLDAAHEDFLAATVRYKDPSSKIKVLDQSAVKGWSYGTGESIEAADAALQQHKSTRKAAGLRVERESVETPRGPDRRGDSDRRGVTGRDDRGASAEAVDLWTEADAAIRHADGTVHAKGTNHEALHQRLGIKPKVEGGVWKDDWPGVEEGFLVRGKFISTEDMEKAQGDLQKAFDNANESPVKPPSEPPSGDDVPDIPAGPPRRPNDSAWLRIREFVEDDWIRVKKLVDDPSARVTEASDPYTAEILFHGRLGSRVEEAKELVTKIDRDIVATAKTFQLPDSTLQADVDRFLHARHAPERNALIGARAAGMSDDEAAAIIGEINASPQGREVQRIADQIQDLNNRTLDVLLEGEVITPELHARLREAYKNHVPLNRILDDTDDVGALLSTRPLDVRSTGLFRAKGSERQVADITTNIVTNYQQALIRAEKNRVDLATLRFARDNPERGLFTEIKPKPIGKSFDGETVIFGKPPNDPKILPLREGGKPVYLRINDASLAAALRGINRLKVDGILRFAQAYTRALSSLATRFNPEFFLPNKLRDLQEAAIYAFSKKGIGAKGAASMVAHDPASVRDVIAGLRGADTEGAVLYRQMRADGGTTGGLGLSTRQQVELDIEKIRKMNRSAPRRAAHETLSFIDRMNQVFEDSTRLSIYRTALERGLSRTEAARLAKEGTINFNKFGRGGPQINALYMFANASIQGSAKMLRAMRNPKVAGTVVTATGAAVAAVAEWNDRIDPEWRAHVSKYDRLSSLTVMLPPGDDGSANYIKVPVSWGLRPIKVAMDYASDAMGGHVGSPGDAVAGTLAATVEAYNPIGGTDLVSAATPTALDLPVDIGRNRAWHGGMIKPNWDRDAPESEKYFDSLSESATGQTAIAASERMASVGIEISPADIKYAYESLVGGAGRTAGKVVNTISSIGRGKAPDVNEVPVVSRFVEHVSPERIEQMEASYEEKNP